MTTQTAISEIVEVTVAEKTLSQFGDAEALATTVDKLKITNNAEYTNSAEFLKQIKSTTKVLDDARKDITKPLDEAKKRVMDLFRGPIEKLAQAETVLKRAILTYSQEQDRIRKEAEAKALAAARAEEERKRKALEERAAKEAEKGNTAKAEALQEKAENVYVPTVVLAPPTPEKISGISTKKVWKFRITDEKAIPRDYLVVNETMLGKLAQATQGKVPVAGVEFYQEDVLSAGRAF